MLSEEPAERRRPCLRHAGDEEPHRRRYAFVAPGRSRAVTARENLAETIRDGVRAWARIDESSDVMLRSIPQRRDHRRQGLHTRRT